MSEYRNRTTGEVKTQGQWRSANPNMSLPRVWNNNVCDALGIDPVLAAPQPSAGQYQIVQRDGAVQDANGNWVYAWKVVDMFSDDAELGTKAEQEAKYQATLDAQVAEANRNTRNRLLSETDYLALSDTTLSPEMAQYRQLLRDITSLENWPNLTDLDWPVKP
jgi:hypothetical protein